MIYQSKNTKLPVPNCKFEGDCFVTQSLQHNTATITGIVKFWDLIKIQSKVSINK